MRGMRTRALWMAIGLVLGSSALAVAAVGVDGSLPEKANNKASEARVSAQEKKADAEATKAAKAEAKGQGLANGERKMNHGFYVSAAAQCEDVDDAETETSFTAPEDCSSNGKAHGAYVSSVAKSDAGKKPKEEPAP